MQHLSGFIAPLAGIFLLTSCTPAPPVVDSRELVWQQFGHQPVDNVLMSWGTPSSETHLTDGSRLITYRHSSVYDAESPYERSSACEVSFLAKQSAHYRIENVAMEGSPFDCQRLAQGQVGEIRQMYVPPPYPYPYPYPYRRYPF